LRALAVARVGVSDRNAREERKGTRGPHNSSGKPFVRADPNAVIMGVRRGDLLGAAIALLKCSSRRI